MNRVLTFEEAGHRYYLDGKRVPGNTEILKAEGFIDTTWYTESARDRGKRVHKACWFLDEGDLDWSTVWPGDRPYVEAFAEFKVRSGFRSEINEFPVWANSSDQHVEEAVWATTPDILGVLDGPGGLRRGVLNLKTGAVQPWVGLQLSGERLATVARIQAQDQPWTQRLEWIDGHPYPVARWALELRRDGKYRLKEFTDSAEEIKYLETVRKYHARVAA